MADMLVAFEDKTPKELLLLGDITIELTDCDGNRVTAHGLLANDLSVKTLDGDILPLTQFVMNYAGDTPDLTTATITNSNGDVVSLQEVVNSLNEVQFDIQDLQEKYNNL